MEKWLNLKEIFDIESWETLQDALSEVTKMAILMVNYKGEPITKHSGCHTFCDRVRHDSKMKKFCQKCDARAGFEAMQDNEPFIYKCYFGIVDIAIPIIVNDQYIGAIMAGQIRVSDGGDKLEQLLHVTDRELLEEKRKQYDAEFHRLPFLSFGRIRVISNLLYYLCNYMSSEGAKKEQILRLYERTLSGSMEEENYRETIREGMRFGRDEAGKIEVENQLERMLPDGCSHIVRDSLYLVLTNRDRMYSMRELAETTHVSRSYFSRIFKKEMGTPYTEFLQRIKCEWAQKLLTEEDLTVADVADRLGYTDVGYFIKVFKKQTGVTPHVYKNYHKKLPTTVKN